MPRKPNKLLRTAVPAAGFLLAGLIAIGVAVTASQSPGSSSGSSEVAAATGETDSATAPAGAVEPPTGAAAADTLGTATADVPVGDEPTVTAAPLPAAGEPGTPAQAATSASASPADAPLPTASTAAAGPGITPAAGATPAPDSQPVPTLPPPIPAGSVAGELGSAAELVGALMPTTAAPGWTEPTEVPLPEGSPFRLMVGPRGAGIARLELEGVYEDGGTDGQPLRNVAVQHEITLTDPTRPSLNGERPLTQAIPFEILGLRIAGGGVQRGIGLSAPGVWRPGDRPGEFLAELAAGPAASSGVGPGSAGDAPPAVVIRRRYVYDADRGSHGLTVEQTIENNTPFDLTFTLVQFGPTSMDKSPNIYAGDKRRFRSSR